MIVTLDEHVVVTMGRTGSRFEVKPFDVARSYSSRFRKFDIEPVIRKIDDDPFHCRFHAVVTQPPKAATADT